ncbi:hypothetical protein [Pseudorhodoferax sp. Leaf274]|uniref:hypothetical protein n=1 Tax=Pseudorhodoferax sp. Leaf274 TaxID=1736318 RepID=UPI000702C156|nr:hypothetical protein [Pseudorhodoferax sp. Leaf274]KQP36122.1 hypothetical protein ASF44_16260 [Pseudorhodoferax sp. Leaf274]
MANYDTQIMVYLSKVGGSTTGTIANYVRPMFGHSARTHSAFIRTRLLALQKEGKVAPMDELKPVAWVRLTDG